MVVFPDPREAAVAAMLDTGAAKEERRARASQLAQAPWGQCSAGGTVMWSRSYDAHVSCGGRCAGGVICWRLEVRDVADRGRC